MTAAPLLLTERPTPAIMLNPGLLAPGEPWEHSCRIVMRGHDRQGNHRTLFCGIKTQGGMAGLRAHQATVHREP